MRKLTVAYAVILLVLLYVLVFGHNGIMKYSNMIDDQRQYEHELQLLEDNISRTEQELELLRTDKDYLDYVIRKELGLQKSDEDQYIISNDATIPSQ